MEQAGVRDLPVPVRAAVRAVRLPVAGGPQRAAADAGPGDPGRRGRSRQDHRGRPDPGRAPAARAGRPLPDHHPARAAGPVAGGARAQVRRAHGARRTGNHDPRTGGGHALARRWHRPAGHYRVAGHGAARPAQDRADRGPMGPDHRRRGAPGEGAAQRLGEADPRAALASPAAAHRHPGGEPAAGSLRDGEPRRARPAGHVRAVPRGARRGRSRAGHGAAERACPPEADRRGDDQAPAE